MKFTPIKFHQGEGYLLDETSTKLLTQKLVESYSINTQIDFKTPGYKYYKFLQENDLETLKAYPHYVALNYGLNPIWCLWLTRINETNYSIYINLVTQKMIYSPYRFQDQVYQQNILIEGEILSDPEHTFLMWDVIGFNGKPIHKFMTLTQRYEKLRVVYNFQYQADHLIDNLKLKIRRIVPYDQIKALTQETSRPHQGLIFLPYSKSTKCYSFRYYRNNLRDPLQVSPQDLEILKIRKAPPKAEHPSDIEDRYLWATPYYFQNKEEYDNYLLYEWDDTQNGPIHIIGRSILTSLENSQKIAQYFDNPTTQAQSKDGITPLLRFKCRYSKKFHKWEPYEYAPSSD